MVTTLRHCSRALTKQRTSQQISLHVYPVFSSLMKKNITRKIEHAHVYRCAYPSSSCAVFFLFLVCRITGAMATLPYAEKKED